MGVLSDGNPYGLPPGLVFSFPMERVGGGDKVAIADDLVFSPAIKELLDKSAKELIEEKEEIADILSKLN
jgi:hypothetical protein